MATARKKILVIGGRGFIGGHIARELLNSDYDVCIYSSSDRVLENLTDILQTHADRISQVVGNGLCSNELKRILAEVSGVVHAAIPYPIYSLGWKTRWKQEKKQLECLLTNLIPHKGIPVVFVSVSGTIGQLPNGMSHEGIAYNKAHLKTSLHMKYYAEEMIQNAIKQGLRGIIVNPALCIGPWDTKPSSGQFMIVACTLPFGFMSSYPINATSVRNVAKGTVAALTKGSVGERYLLGDKNTTFGAYMSELRSVAGKKEPKLNIPLPILWFTAFCSECIGLALGKSAPALPLMAIDMVRYGLQHYDLTKMKHELNDDLEPLEQSIIEAYSWFIEHGYIKP
ncbi:MAG: NAD-dependent epimerase/dehydratase family protein [Candidatus Thiodiazotropha sp.]|jgi:dihydroflavonol-4-reductase